MTSFSQHVATYKPTHMTSLFSMAGYGVVDFIDPAIIFTIIIVIVTIYLLYWITQNNNDAAKVTKQKEEVTVSTTPSKSKPSASRQPKKRNVGRSGAAPGFTHPHLVANLKGHTDLLTGGDFTASGKHYITTAEVSSGSDFDSKGWEEKDPRKVAYKENTSWQSFGPVLSSNTPSDTEESLVSTSSGSKSKSRRNRNKKRRSKYKKKRASCEKSNNSSLPSVPNTKNLFNQLGLTEDQLHKSLLKYCTTIEDRILCGFPYATNQGTFIFKAQGYSSVSAALAGHTLVEAEMNEFKYMNHRESTTEQSDFSDGIESGDSDYNKPCESDCNMNYYSTTDDGFYYIKREIQRCRRCKQQFCVSANGEKLCFYHSKKAVLKKDGNLRYQCCNRKKEALGCITTTLHVYQQLHPGLNGPLKGFVPTKLKTAKRSRVFGLDCEMIYTSEGFEVARVTLVTVMGNTILDLFVHPQGTVFDYNTEYSGITAQSMDGAVSFQEAQEAVLGAINCSDIIVGHSLEGDLAVLKILHRRVLDTSLLFRCGNDGVGSEWRGCKEGNQVPTRSSLKNIVKKTLGIDIQTSDGAGHNSYEDATSALKVVFNHLWEGTPLPTSSHKTSKVAPLPLMLQALTL